MQTYTFDTIIQNGTITIPDEYKNITSGEVKITIQKEEAISRKKTYDTIELDTTNFIFNREESNAR